MRTFPTDSGQRSFFPDQESLPTIEREEMGACGAEIRSALSGPGLVKHDNWQAACQQLRPMSFSGGKIARVSSIVKCSKDVEKSAQIAWIPDQTKTPTLREGDRKHSEWCVAKEDESCCIVPVTRKTREDSGLPFRPKVCNSYCCEIGTVLTQHPNCLSSSIRHDQTSSPL